MPDLDVAIIGGGIAGLTAAIHLQNDGLDVKVFEAGPKPGGRVQTDKVGGFLLDRGFQVFLTASPEARRMLDYSALGLRPFYPGALVRYGKKLCPMGDPFRNPFAVFNLLRLPFSTTSDKLKTLVLRNRLRRQTLPEIFAEKESSTLQFLREWHFSEKMIDAFFKPFFGGVLLDPKLQTSDRVFKYAFKMFSEGQATLPLHGMGAIAKQLADRLLPGTFAPNMPAKKVESGRVTFAGGAKTKPRAILVATNAANAQQLLGDYEGLETGSKGVKCLYFSTDMAPIARRMIALNGTGNGWVNNMCIPSTISHRYAPPGKHLISISVIKSTGKLTDAELAEAVKAEMEEWFGMAVRYWTHLKTYNIEYALPADLHTRPMGGKADAKPLMPGVFACGDHSFYGSLDGAMTSARHTANAIADYLAANPA